MDALGSSLQSAAAAPAIARRCVFCHEDIRPGASVCPHCGSNLAPVQALADQYAALEERIAALERESVALRTARSEQAQTGNQSPAAVSYVVDPAPAVILRWPHMVDNIFLGLAALVAAHWIAATLPMGNRSIFRLVALAVALPFGFRFERNARSSTAGQVLAALAFASLGTLAIGVLDLLLGAHGAPPVLAADVLASFATIALSHFAGSALVQAWRARKERQAAAQRAASSPAGGGGPLEYFAPAHIKSTAETVKALYDAAAPLAAGAAALWAAVGHIFF